MSQEDLEADVEPVLEHVAGHVGELLLARTGTHANTQLPLTSGASLRKHAPIDCKAPLDHLCAQVLAWVGLCSSFMIDALLTAMAL